MGKKEIKLGKYKHFKRKEYQVIGTARHSETLEDLVVYKEIGKDQLWARPKEMFFQQVEKDGKKVSRFILEK